MTYNLTYQYENKSYTVIVTKKRMKSITFRLNKDIFYVSSPWYVNKYKITSLLDKFAPKMIKKENSKTKPIIGNEIYVFGEKCELNDSNILTLKTGEAISYKDLNDLKNKLKPIFLNVVEQRVRIYEDIMSAPRYKVAIGDAKSRYGSNSLRTKTLRFSTMLVHYSINIIDSVVVHELAHCFYMDHSKNFYNVVYKYYPEYKRYHTYLKKGIYHE